MRDVERPQLLDLHLLREATNVEVRQHFIGLKLPVAYDALSISCSVTAMATMMYLAILNARAILGAKHQTRQQQYDDTDADRDSILHLPRTLTHANKRPTTNGETTDQESESESESCSNDEVNKQTINQAIDRSRSPPRIESNHVLHCIAWHCMAWHGMAWQAVRRCVLGEICGGDAAMRSPSRHPC